MIDRFDVSCNLDNLRSGRYVLYEDHLDEIKKLEAELIRNEGCYVDAIGEYRLEEQDLRKKVKKLEGWLKYLYFYLHGIVLTDKMGQEISGYIKAMEEKKYSATGSTGGYKP